jgi:exodeoxyribonuclease VII small subunit
MSKSSTDYSELQEQLDAVLARLQAADVHVDEAVKLYEQGLKLVAALEAHLKQAENTIEKLKLQHAPGKE